MILGLFKKIEKLKNQKNQLVLNHKEKVTDSVTNTNLDTKSFSKCAESSSGS